MKLKFLCIWLFVMCLSISQAQEPPAFLLFEASEGLIQVDLNTLTQTTILDNSSNAEFLRVNFPYVYMLQGSYPGPDQVQPRQLLRYNLNTGQTEILYQRDNFIAQVSPDNQYAFIGYFVGSVPNGGAQLCILELISTHCALTNYFDMTNIWKDSQMLVLPRSSGDAFAELSLLNPSNLQFTPLVLLENYITNAQISSVTLINNQQQLLFSTDTFGSENGLEDNRIFIYNFESNHVDDLAYYLQTNPRYGDGSTIISVAPSPSLTYLAYTSVIDTFIVEFETGHVIKHFAVEDLVLGSVNNVMWLNDDTLLVGDDNGVYRYVVSQNTLESVGYGSSTHLLELLPAPLPLLELPLPPATYTPTPIGTPFMSPTPLPSFTPSPTSTP